MNNEWGLLKLIVILTILSLGSLLGTKLSTDSSISHGDTTLHHYIVGK